MNTETTTQNCITYTITFDAYKVEHLHDFIWRHIVILYKKAKALITNIRN